MLANLAAYGSVLKGFRLLALAGAVAATCATAGAIVARAQALPIAYWVFEDVSTTTPGSGVRVNGYGIDPSDRPVVSWTDAGAPHPFWSRKDAGAWATTVFNPNKLYPGSGDSALGHEMALAPDGTPWMAFDGAIGEEYYMWLTDLNADPTGATLSTNIGHLVSIRVCPYGEHTLAFTPGGAPSDLRYLNGCNPFHSRLILNGVNAASDLGWVNGADYAISPDGGHHILYSDSGAVRHSNGSGIGTPVFGIDRFSGDVQIEADLLGTLHAVIRGYGSTWDGDRGILVYLTSTDGGTTWSAPETIDASRGALYPVLALDRNGIPAVAFWSWGNGLYYGSRASGAWQFSRVFSPPGWAGAEKSSRLRLSVDSANTPSIAFADWSAQRVRIARPMAEGGGGAGDAPADLRVSIAASQNVAPIGATLTYTVSLVNQGARDATGIVLNVAVPANFTYVSASPAPASASGGSLTFNFGGLHSGVGTSVSINARAITQGKLPLQGTATAVEPEANAADNAAQLVVDVRGDQCFAPRSGMKSWWPAEGNGTDVINGFGLGLYGGAGYAPGKIGRAFSFDGTGYARTTFWWHQDTTFVPGPNSFSMQAWIRTSRTTGWQVIAGWAQAAGDPWNYGPAAYWLSVNDGRLSAYIRDVNSGETGLTGPSVSDGQFHHVALVRDMAVLELRLYLDGALAASQSLVGGAQGSIQRNRGNDSQFSVGFLYTFYGTTPNYFLAGEIDDLAWYTRALGGDEIATLYANVNSVACGAPGPPTVTVPADMAVEATGPDGATVTFETTALDFDGAPLSPICTPASGSVFGIATTAVSCSATDASARTGTASFNVTVSDTTPPALTLPADMTATATDASGAPVSFAVTATDFVDDAVSATCVPASDTTFPIGTTTVSCSATDHAGNQTTGSFTITVETPPPAIINIAEVIHVTDAPALLPSVMLNIAEAVHVTDAATLLPSVMLSVTETVHVTDAATLTLPVPPTVTVPADMTVEATGAAGATVSFAAAAVDFAGAALSPTCTPASGSAFAIATTLVSCSATDAGGRTATASFNVTVTDTNRAPQLVSPGAQVSTAGDRIDLPLVAADPDGDRLTFSATGLPPDLTLDAANGRIGGVIAPGVAGIFDVTASVTDGRLEDAQVFPWRVLARETVVSVSSTILSVWEGDEGLRPARFVLTLSAPSTAPVSVDYATRDGLIYDQGGYSQPSGRANIDYAPSSGTIVFNPGETSKTLDAFVISNFLSQHGSPDQGRDARFFFVDLSPRGAVMELGQNAVLTVRILDDDDPQGSVWPTRVEPGAEVTTDCPGCGDHVYFVEPLSGYPVSESFGRPVHAPALPGLYSVVVGSRHVGWVTVTEPLYHAKVDIGVPSTVEGFSETDQDQRLPIRLTLSQPFDAPVSMSYVTFKELNAGQPVQDLESGTVTFVPGETSKELSLLVPGNRRYEGDYAVGIRLFNAVGPGESALFFKELSASREYGQFYRGGRTLKVGVQDDDLQVVVFPPSVVAGGTAATMLVKGVADPARTRVALFSEGAPYEAGLAVASYPLAGFPPDSEGTLTVPFRVPNAIGRFELRLLESSDAWPGEAFRGRPALLTVVKQPSVAIRGGSIREGDGDPRAIDFHVTLSHSSATPVTIAYETRDVTAVAGVDYTATSGSMVFQPGEQEKVISVPVTGNRTAGPSRTFVVHLLSATAGTEVTTPEASATILDDDRALYVTGVSPARVQPGDMVSEFLTFGPPNEPSVFYAGITTPDNPLYQMLTSEVESIYVDPALDRRGVSQTVRFHAPHLPGLFAIGSVYRSLPPNVQGLPPYEGGQSYTPNSNSAFTVVEPLNVSTPARSRGILEALDAGAIDLPVTLLLSEAVGEPVSVDYVVHRQNANQDLHTGTIVFAAGQTEAHIPITIPGNTWGGQETVSVTLRTPHGTPTRALHVFTTMASYTQQDAKIAEFAIRSIGCLSCGGGPATTPPQIQSVGNQTSQVGEAVQLQVYATGAASDPLSFSAAGLPTGLGIDSQTGLVSGEVKWNETEWHTVDVTASNAGGAATTSFVWRVINTLPGQNVTAVARVSSYPAFGVTVAYDTVSSPGFTVAVPLPEEPTLPGGFSFGDPPIYFDLSTTSGFDGASVCLSLGRGVQRQNDWRILHLEGGVWVDRTSFVDRQNNILCADVTSFSPFAVAVGSNHFPVADAGGDRLAEASAADGTLTSLDAVGSYDFDGDPLTYTWTGPFGTATGRSVAVLLPLGPNAIVLDVDDGHGGSSRDEIVVIVRDTIAPTVTIANPAGVTYAFNQTVVASYACADSGSGVASCTGPVPSGSPLDTSREGAHTFAVTAQDEAGNAATTAVTYIVMGVEGRMEGGGEIRTPDGREHKFEFRIAERRVGLERGALHYRVKTPKAGKQKERADRFESTSIGSIVFWDDPAFKAGRGQRPIVDSAIFSGTGKWNGAPGFTFEARAADEGEPGRGHDTLAITIRDARGTVAATVTGALTGGNIQSSRLPDRHKAGETRR